MLKNKEKIFLFFFFVLLLLLLFLCIIQVYEVSNSSKDFAEEIFRVCSHFHYCYKQNQENNIGSTDFSAINCFLYCRRIWWFSASFLWEIAKSQTNPASDLQAPWDARDAPSQESCWGDKEGCCVLQAVPLAGRTTREVRELAAPHKDSRNSQGCDKC